MLKHISLRKVWNIFVFIYLLKTISCCSKHLWYFGLLYNLALSKKHICMEARFHHWIKNKKVIAKFYSQNCDFMSRNCDFISRISDFISENREFISQYYDFLTRNCEIKSRNYLLNFLFSGGNRVTSIRLQNVRIKKYINHEYGSTIWKSFFFLYLQFK